MEEHEPVPVIWAILDPYDSVQYVRVQRTFLIREKEDWETLNRDSLEFNDVEVFLYGSLDGQIKWREQFIKTTRSKEDGFFPSGDYQVFMIDHPLPIEVTHAREFFGGVPDIDSLYLEVWIHDIDRVIEAGAPCISPGRVLYAPRGTMFYIYQEFCTKFTIYGGYSGECGELSSGDLCYRQTEFWVHIKEHYEDHVESKTLNWRTTSGYDASGWYNLTPERLFNPMKQQMILWLLPGRSTVLMWKLRFPQVSSSNTIISVNFGVIRRILIPTLTMAMGFSRPYDVTASQDLYWSEERWIPCAMATGIKR
jgi:hypothetical protein